MSGHGSAEMPAHGVLLADGAATLGLNLEPGQVEQLLRFADLMQRWGSVFNLTAVRAVDAIVIRHLLDSLAVIPSIDRWAGSRALRLLDVGSGAGLPAIVIATLRPGWQITAVDAVAKKVAFMRQAAGEMGLRNLDIWHGRVEAMPGSMRDFDLIVSRAFASMADFVKLTMSRVGPGGAWVAMKGRVSEAELAELKGQHPEVDLFHVEQLAVPGTSAARNLVWIRPH